MGKTSVMFVAGPALIVVTTPRVSIIGPPKSSGPYGTIRWNGPEVGGLPLLCWVMNEPARCSFLFFCLRLPYHRANPTIAASPSTPPMHAPTMAPLFTTFFGSSVGVLVADFAVPVAFPATAMVVVPVELLDFEDFEELAALELEVELLKLEEEEEREEEDADEVEDEDEEDLLAADDVVLAAADTGLKFTPVNTTCRSSSEACPEYVVSTEVASSEAPQPYW